MTWMVNMPLGWAHEMGISWEYSNQNWDIGNILEMTSLNMFLYDQSIWAVLALSEVLCDEKRKNGNFHHLVSPGESLRTCLVLQANCSAMASSFTHQLSNHPEIDRSHQTFKNSPRVVVTRKTPNHGITWWRCHRSKSSNFGHAKPGEFPQV